MPGAGSVSPPFVPPFRVVKASGGDDYAKAQAALDASVVDGREVLIWGKLRLSAGLVISDPRLGVSIRGLGPGAGFEPYDASASSIDLLTLRVTLTPPSGFYEPIAVRDLKFTNRTGTGAAAHSGAGLVIASTWGTDVRNCFFYYLKDGIVCTTTLDDADYNGNQVTSISDIRIVGPHTGAHTGIWLKGSTEIVIRNVLAVIGSGSPEAGSMAMLIQSRDAIEVSHFDCVNYDIGIKIAPNGPMGLNGGMWFWNCMCDTGGTGWVLIGDSNNLDDIECHGCWASYNIGWGITLAGSTLSGFRWIGGIIQGNVSGGIHIGAGTAHQINGARISGNDGPGIEIANGVGQVQIQNNIITDPHGYGGGHEQEHGIKFNGGHTRLLVQNNDMVGNLTAPTTGDYSGATNKVQGNGGLNPKGVLGPPSVPATNTAYTNAYGHDCTVFVAGGTVTDVKIGGTSTGMTSGAFRVPAGQTITITHSVAPTWTWFGD